LRRTHRARGDPATDEARSGERIGYKVDPKGEVVNTAEINYDRRQYQIEKSASCGRARKSSLCGFCNLYSTCCCSKAVGGFFLLRISDIDHPTAFLAFVGQRHRIAIGNMCVRDCVRADIRLACNDYGSVRASLVRSILRKDNPCRSGTVS